MLSLQNTPEMGVGGAPCATVPDAKPMWVCLKREPSKKSWFPLGVLLNHTEKGVPSQRHTPVLQEFQSIFGRRKREALLSKELNNI